MNTPRSLLRSPPGLSFVLLLVLLAVLWLAGGASRADVPGQLVVRSTSWSLLVVIILFGRVSLSTVRPVWIFTCAALALVLLQLLPLPPALWTILPGRALLLEASAASGQAQPWRPWSIAPGATLNAAFSLVVPFTVLLLAASLRDEERARLPTVLLVVVIASAILGLVQFSGSVLNNPLINATAGEVSGTFANRNHFALFMALGCPLAAVWAFGQGHRVGWRGPVGLGLVLLFVLIIMGSGSRAGLGLGAAGLLGAGLIVRHSLARTMQSYPRWVFPAVIAGSLIVIVLFVLVSLSADRAVSINRLMALDQGKDMRGRGFPVVLDMVATYFPVGTGIGSFNPLFRIHEPFGLLKPTFFNHAHNDLLEVALDAGLPGLVLLAAAIGWWGWASVAAWRTASKRAAVLPRLGSILLLLIIAASVFDYPVRTPMVMAVTIIAGVWLCGSKQHGEGAPLPVARRHL